VERGLLSVEDSRSYSEKQGSVGLLQTRDRPIVAKPIPNYTQHLEETDIHASGGIRTRSLSKRTAADRRTRPRGHWDRNADYQRF
jgi:hypothetical protein